MDKNKEEKIKYFMNDKVMNRAVYEVLLDSFLNEKIANDVQVLAASRLSVNFLKEAWKNLERFRNKKEEDVEVKVNVGV
jgi:hypothetical protein